MAVPGRAFDPDTTCWTLIRGAAAGAEADRETFARLYLPVVRAYLEARWRNSPLHEEVEDTAQDVFLECFRDEGALGKVDPEAPNSRFRKFLYAVVRNVARRVEDRRLRRREQPGGSAVAEADRHENEASLSEVFERAWLASLLDQTFAVQKEQAATKRGDAERRVELLRLRFNDELPMRAIAERWGMPASKLYFHYSKALKEFTAALRTVIAFHHPSDPEGQKAELERLRAYIGES